LSEDYPAHLAGFRPDALLAGSLLAGYRLEAQIGAGGMAVVFRAHDERLGRLVALKILAQALASDPGFRRRFIAESRAAAAVDDPHIIPIYEAGESGGALFIAMRFVRGGDLRGVLDREGAMAPVRAAAFISPVASALDAAHQAGLVHRDVKPANILVDTRHDRPDHVYLSDFGVSKGVISSVSLTGAGHFLGTPDYSAPEQIQGLAVDGRTDQYALACVAYQLLAGVVPFERDQGMAVLFAHMSEPPPSLGRRRPGLPTAVDEVLARGMAKVPEKRFGSCAGFADALRDALGLAPYISDRPAPTSDRPPPLTTVAPPPIVASPRYTGSAAVGTPAVPADPVVATTIDSAPVGRAGRDADEAAPAETGMVHEAAPADTGMVDEGSRLTGPLGTVGEPARPPWETAEPRPAAAGSATTPDGPRAYPASRTWSRRGSHGAQPARSRPLPIITVLVAVLLLAIVGSIYGFWRYSQGQYYVGYDIAANGQDQVVIYRGINQSIIGLSLSHPYQATGIQLSQVPSNYQGTVKATDPASGLAGAEQVVANIRTAVSQCQQAYVELKQWAAAETTYKEKVALAQKNRKPTRTIPQPGPQPPLQGALCAPSSAFGIPAKDLVPTVTTPPTSSGHS
jgi:serine/threonine protein kinase